MSDLGDWLRDEAGHDGQHLSPTNPHGYLTEACLHGRHVMCRAVCPYCPALCRCLCHTSRFHVEPG